MLFELIILAGGIIGILGGLLGWEFPLLRGSIAGLMIIYGLACYPYPKEDRHKVSLAIGCIVFILSGFSAFFISSWWVLPAGVVSGFGFAFGLDLILRQLSQPITNQKNGKRQKECKDRFYYEFEGHLFDYMRDGIHTYWYKNGQKHYENRYKDGELISESVWKPNGDPCPITNISDGTGITVHYHENGRKKSEGHFKDGVEDGLWIWWYENGQKQDERTYRDGERDGIWTAWYKNGHKRVEGYYKNGKSEGLYTFWDEGGKKRREIQHKEDKIISTKKF